MKEETIVYTTFYEKERIIERLVPEEIPKEYPNNLDTRSGGVDCGYLNTRLQELKNDVYYRQSSFLGKRKLINKVDRSRVAKQLNKEGYGRCKGGKIRIRDLSKY